MRLAREQIICVLLITVLGSSGVVAADTTPTAYERMVEQISHAIRTCKAMAEALVGYDAVFRRDPMRPLIDGQGQRITSGGLHGGLSVEGVIWSEDQPLAVIDDELFTRGQIVGPYHIVSIQPDGIVVRRLHQADTLFVPLDRGIEPQLEHLAPSLLQSQPEDAATPAAATDTSPASSEHAPAALTAPQ